jgi:hypothetical protein
MDKKNLGTGGGGLVHVIWMEFGANCCREFINNTQFTVNNWLLENGQSIGAPALPARWPPPWRAPRGHSHCLPLPASTPPAAAPRDAGPPTPPSCGPPLQALATPLPTRPPWPPSTTSSSAPRRT